MNAHQVHDVANALAAMRRAAKAKPQAAAVELEEDFWDITTRRTAGFDDEAEAEVRLHEYHAG